MIKSKCDFFVMNFYYRMRGHFKIFLLNFCQAKFAGEWSCKWWIAIFSKLKKSVLELVTPIVTENFYKTREKITFFIHSKDQCFRMDGWKKNDLGLIRNDLGKAEVYILNRLETFKKICTGENLGAIWTNFSCPFQTIKYF